MITKIEMKDIPGRACGYNNFVAREIEDFCKSDWDTCEVRTNKYKNVHSAFSAYKAAIKRANANVICFERSGRLFLARKEATK